MKQLKVSKPSTPPKSAAASSRAPVGLFVAGLVATIAALGYVALDQTVLGGLNAHLHAVYDPYGRYGQPGPLYGYLYALDGLGVASWLICLHRVRYGARSARIWSVSVLVLAGLAISPLMLQEYGRLVFGIQFGAMFSVIWLIGLAGTLLLFRRAASR
ncbi:MAG TPA: hypothetical protein VIP98_07575 [Microlunatus sp.]